MKKNIKLEKKCIEQNKKLINLGLAFQTFGNVSIKIDNNHFFIKPSGIDAKILKNGDCPIIRIHDGLKIQGKYYPSTDMQTHLELYRNFKVLNSISHCHSKYATAWAQGYKAIPLLGTTHADFWNKEIPLIEYISKKELFENYELFTGKLIIKKLFELKTTPLKCTSVLVAGHGVFSWSDTYEGAVLNSELCEYIAEIAYLSLKIGIRKKIPNYISKKHFDRKHGKNAYYGQKK